MTGRTFIGDSGGYLFSHEAHGVQPPPFHSRRKFDKIAACDKIPLREEMETRQTIQSTPPETSAEMELSIGGMSCNNCARHVTEAIQGVSGVRSATVILDAGRASVRWNPGAGQNVSAVIEAVQKAGYTAKEIRAGASAGCETRHASWQINLWLGVTVTTALMAGEWGFGLGLRAVVSMAFLCAGRRGPNFRRGKILPRRVEPAQNRRLEHGHARRARFDDRVWLQRVGVARWPGRPCLFHGSRRHHHAHQLRPLAGSPRERARVGRIGTFAESRAPNRPENSEFRIKNPESRKPAPQSEDADLYPNLRNPQSADPKWKFPLPN